MHEFSAIAVLVVASVCALGCGDSAGTGGGGGSVADGASNGAGGDGNGGNGNGGSGSGAGGENGCVPPTDPGILTPDASCLTGTLCAGNSDCDGGSRCNTNLSPPECELLYCGGPNTSCSSNALEVCAKDLVCMTAPENGPDEELRCLACDVCGGTRCYVDFTADHEHCGCCDNPVETGGYCNSGSPTGAPPAVDCAEYAQAFEDFYATLEPGDCSLSDEQSSCIVATYPDQAGACQAEVELYYGCIAAAQPTSFACADFDDEVIYAGTECAVDEARLSYCQSTF